MKRNKLRIIAAIMSVVAVIFTIVAITHPEYSFPWSSGITTGIYIAYIVMVVIFVIAPFEKRR